MSSLPMSVAGIVALVIGFIIITKITGFIIRLVVLAGLVAFLFYLYQSGAHTIFMAPGAPSTETIASLI